MKIKVISDLHLEFGNIYMIPEFVSGDYDILVIAGDVSDSNSCMRCLHKIDKEVNKPVLFIPGNHEYYHATKTYIDEELKSHQFKNVIVLNDAIIKIDDIVFIGGTAYWNTGITSYHMRCLTDFTVVYDIMTADAGMQWGRKTMKFFEDSLKKYKDERVICISHNMPSMKCISPEFQKSDINECFANNYDDMIEEYSPEYWICGHTHDSIDMNLYDTKVVCNPYGYHRHALNKDFDMNLIIEV